MFENLEALEKWLQEKGIDTAVWGQANSKTAADLWQEIAAGETILNGDPMRRRVNVVEVIVYQGAQMLIEAAQELADGRTRQRRLPPSEKIKPGEDILQAARRCLWEEVNISEQNILSISQSEGKRCHERPSPSYPGLITHYTVYRVETAVTNLPTHNFWHTNVAHTANDPVKRHLWVWVSANYYP
ncbi:MAG: NUDIX domain-containing protein [Chloroflexi bacterium]|nr:NUDIX domain-containing protein [Chloroflexota bacterium]